MKRDIGQGVPILGLTGVNGAGKTLVAVTLCIRRMQAGRRVYSTVPIRYVDPGTGQVFESEPILSLEQLLHIPRNSTVFLDDVAVILPSGSISLPPEVEVLLHTLRHREIDVIWTAPGWMRANNNLRLVTQGLVNVQPTLKVSDPGTPWPTPRLVFLTLFDTGIGKPDATPDRILRRSLAIPTRLAGFGAYDTLADTPVLRAVRRPSHCAACNGSYPMVKHSRERHEAMGLPWYDDLPQKDERPPTFSEVEGH